jgi:hypothetical protein
MPNGSHHLNRDNGVQTIAPAIASTALLKLKTMTNFKLFLHAGKLMVGEFPKEPSGTFASYPKSHEEYYDAVRTAKETAVEIINPEIMEGLLYLETASEGMMGDMPHLWTVEYEETCKRDGNRDACGNEVCWDLQECQKSPSKKIARLIPSKSSGIVATGIAEPLPGKGDKGGECNRTHCKNPHAEFYNHSTRMYYCAECAVLLNDANRTDAIRIFGHELCTLEDSPVIPEGSEKAGFRALFEKYKRMNWSHEYAENGIINFADFLKIIKELKP